MKSIALLLVAGVAAGVASADIVKPPDLGDYWQPLNPNGGTYVYADSFIADDTTIECLGTWLNDGGSGGSSVRFEVWGDIAGGGGPDANAVIASTGSLPIFGAPGGVLTYFQAPASGTMIPGNMYWFAATVVLESGPGGFNVGGHTQNSVYNDNGTFWFSNDASGIAFDGRGLTPEMAFAVCTIPTPGVLSLLGLGGLAVARRRRA